MSVKTPFISPKLCFYTLGIDGPEWFRVVRIFQCLTYVFPVLHLRTCCLACSTARGGSQCWSQTLGDRLACTALISIWSTYYVPNTIWGLLFGGGGNDSAFADCWISGRELRYMGTLFSILSTWLCILDPEQVAKQTHRVSLQLCH